MGVNQFRGQGGAQVRKTERAQDKAQKEKTPPERDSSCFQNYARFFDALRFFVFLTAFFAALRFFAMVVAIM